MLAILKHVHKGRKETSTHFTHAHTIFERQIPMRIINHTRAWMRIAQWACPPLESGDLIVSWECAPLTPESLGGGTCEGPVELLTSGCTTGIDCCPEHPDTGNPVTDGCDMEEVCGSMSTTSRSPLVLLPT